LAGSIDIGRSHARLHAECLSNRLRRSTVDIAPVDLGNRCVECQADPTPEAAAPTGAVVAAVEAQLADLPAALDRPGVTAVAVKLAQVLDNDSAVPQHAAAARALIEILGTLHKTSARRARLSAVRDMTR
jgi:hypothetical protein